MKLNKVELLVRNYDYYNEEELTYLLENIDNLITEVISIETEEMEDEREI